MSINRQPVFTQSPILATRIFNPVVSTANYSPSSFFGGASLVYTATATEGEAINKITICSTGDTTNTVVSAKLVYVFLYQYSLSAPSLYKTVTIPATTVSATVANPSIELITSGLILNANDAIHIAASANYSAASSYGDYLSVTIEGGSYTYA